MSDYYDSSDLEFQEHQDSEDLDDGDDGDSEEEGDNNADQLMLDASSAPGGTDIPSADDVGNAIQATSTKKKKKEKPVFVQTYFGPDGLAAMPMEMFLAITQRLPTNDLCNISRASKQYQKITREILIKTACESCVKVREAITSAVRDGKLGFLRELLREHKTCRDCLHWTFREALRDYPSFIDEVLGCVGDDKLMAEFLLTKKRWTSHANDPLTRTVWEVGRDFKNTMESYTIIGKLMEKMFNAYKNEAVSAATVVQWLQSGFDSLLNTNISAATALAVELFLEYPPEGFPEGLSEVLVNQAHLNTSIKANSPNLLLMLLQHCPKPADVINANDMDAHRGAITESMYPVHLAASPVREAALLKILVVYGADLTVQYQGRGILYYLFKAGNYEQMIEKLMYLRELDPTSELVTPGRGRNW